jgi:glyoxylase-like metal-dependent hydrolase (beta-lactamase superfamily II)
MNEETNSMVNDFFIVLALLLAPLLAVLFLISRAFTPAPTQHLTDILSAVRVRTVNFYALRTSAGTALFDTGSSAAAALSGLAELGINPDEVTHIFLTHTDYDHAGGVTAFPAAQMYLAAADEQMIDGTTRRSSSRHNKPLTGYLTVADGEVLAVGSSAIRCCHNPGHTPGSMSFLIDDQYLVTGDLLRVDKTGRLSQFLKPLNMDHAENARSIEMMRPIIEATEYLLTGHTGYYRR